MQTQILALHVFCSLWLFFLFFFVPFHWILSAYKIFIVKLWPLCSDNIIIASRFYNISHLSSLSSAFQGQFFSGGNFRIYLLGNPIVWWCNLAFLATFLLTFFIAAIKQQRGYDANEETEVKGGWRIEVGRKFTLNSPVDDDDTRFSSYFTTQSFLMTIKGARDGVL